MYDSFIALVRDWYGTQEFIPLHEPRFQGNEKAYVSEAIDSTFVSSVSDYVPRFEAQLAEYTGAQHAVAVCNGTAALHLALHSTGVGQGDEVITQPLTFVATCNAIKYCGAEPVFVDVAKDTLGLCPDSLASFLELNADKSDSGPVNKKTGHKIKACLPMHTMGLPAHMPQISSICSEWGIPVIEDAAEALGSSRDGRSCGTFGLLGTLSFNGNKIITTGGGGAIITDDNELAEKIRHLATTAKLQHKWMFEHDQIGYNYRMPGLNAAMGVAQIEQLPGFLVSKNELAEVYRLWSLREGVELVSDPVDCQSNNWLNTILVKNEQERDRFLEYTNDQGVMTRPAWALMNDLGPYKNCQTFSDANARDLQKRLVNVPSSARVLG
jgi:aminotransferase in exopolysaccharide biosynthesis